MTNKIFLFLTGCLFIISSCSEEFISKDFDKSRYEPGTFYTTKDHAIQALNAAYAGLNDFNNGYSFAVGVMHFAFGDDLYQTGYAAGFGTWGSINDFVLAPTEGEVGNVWDAYYANILKCNVALQVMPAAQAAVGSSDPTFTDELLNKMMGQAYFLRAFNYWNLYQYFPQDKIIIRRVPPKTLQEYSNAPSPADSTFKFIESDLRKAEALLTPCLNNTAGYEKGRATRGAAVALLGKLYMNKGMYAEAAAEFKKVLPEVGNPAYGTYALTQNFRDNFTRFTENNSESIFEIQYTDINQGSGFSNNDVNWVFQNFTLNRTSWDVMWWNFAVPHFKLDEFENWTENIAGVPTTVYDYRVYSTFWGVPNGANFTDQHGATKDWQAQGWADETVIGVTGVYGIRKYAVDRANEGPADVDPLWSDNNIRIIRLGDIMLRYAECLAKINPGNVTPTDPESAIYWIDKIRTRANNAVNDQSHLYSARGIAGHLPSATALMTSKGWTVMELIEHERYVEGYCEGWRKEDLKRWQKGADYVKYKSGWNGYQSLTLPIPQTELDNNPKM
jgi:tetratricopeptide (TPR) repeat protein